MTTRLTDQERAERAMLEDTLLGLLIGRDGLALLLGWETLHVRPGLRANGRWRTATTGTMAAWPDLVLVRQRDRRLIFAELKRELEQPTEAQERVLEILRALTRPGVEYRGVAFGRTEVHVWRPSDLREPTETSRIYEVLR